MPLLAWVSISVNVVVYVQQLGKHVFFELQVINNHGFILNYLLTKLPLIIRAQYLILRTIKLPFARLFECNLREVRRLCFLDDLVSLKPGFDVIGVVPLE